MPKYHEMLPRIEEKQVIDEFHDLYYSKRLGIWQNTHWLGVPVRKNPCDLMMLQEVIYETRPDVIIETGTLFGGGTLFMANIMDAIGKGRIISIDTEELPRPAHRRITYLQGSSTSFDVASMLQSKDTVMVDLDSDHSKEHVLKELRLYAPLVTEYLIVEDTNTSGPREAVDEFLKDNTQFIQDKSKEKFLLTFNPSGWLRRIDADSQ